MFFNYKITRATNECFGCNRFWLNKGVAVGCGWQTFVAYVNVGCYYLVGVPLGVLLAFKFNHGAKVTVLDPTPPHQIKEQSPNNFP